MDSMNTPPTSTSSRSTRGLLIFGIQDLASLAHFYFNRETKHQVVGFVVDKQFKSQETFENKPLYTMDEVIQKHPPDHCDFFVPMTQTLMGEVRKSLYTRVKEMGYRLPNLISPHATVLGEIEGDNNFIFEDNTIQPFVRIGSNNVLWSGNHIGHHSIIGDHVFITSHVVVSGHVTIGDGSYLGVNSTIRDRVTLAPKTLVGMGAIIGRDTEPNRVYTAPNTKARDNVISEDLI